MDTPPLDYGNWLNQIDAFLAQRMHKANSMGNGFKLGYLKSLMASTLAEHPDAAHYVIDRMKAALAE